MARLLATQVQALSPAGQEQALPILAQHFPIEPRLVSANELPQISLPARQRLEQRGWIAYEDYINSRQVTLVRLGDNRYLQSVGVQHFHGFGWPVVLSLIAVTAFVVGLAVYFLLNEIGRASCRGRGWVSG